MRLAFVNRPEGKGYAQAFSSLMHHQGYYRKKSDGKDDETAKTMFSAVLWFHDRPERLTRPATSSPPSPRRSRKSAARQGDMSTDLGRFSLHGAQVQNRPVHTFVHTIWLRHACADARQHRCRRVGTIIICHRSLLLLERSKLAASQSALFEHAAFIVARVSVAIDQNDVQLCPLPEKASASRPSSVILKSWHR
jgi:hypothetical protein